MNARIPVPLTDGLLIQGDGSAAHAAGVEARSKLYVIRSGLLTELADPAAFRRAGHSPDNVQVIPDAHLAMMPTEPRIPDDPVPLPPRPRPSPSPIPPPGPVPPAPAGLEVTLDLDSDLGAGHFMSTHGMLRSSESGARLDAQTRTRTVTWFGGFHGGVQAVFSDAEGVAIGSSAVQRFGVDGTWIGRSDRTDYWGMDVPPDLANRVVKISLFHFWAPDQLEAVISRAVATLTPIVTLTAAIIGLGGKGATS
jgi:hypothetical protein